VNDVALGIDQDVAIVSILYLQDVAQQRVARETFDEVDPGSLHLLQQLSLRSFLLLRVFREVQQKEVEKVNLFAVDFLYLVD